jgi:phospholipid/cholesterol/gamma-HCH transport system ATP-binding protein
MDEQTVLRVERVSFSLNNQTILQDISLSIATGEIAALVGRSGSGKTILLKLLAGLLIPDSGTISRQKSQSHNPTSLDHHSLPGAECGLVFQEGALLDDIPVWENIGLQWLEQTNASDDHIREKVIELGNRVGLAEGDLFKFPAELSGGMRKKVAIARTLMHQPEIILYDEPTAGLDPGTAISINALIQEISNKNAHSALIVTHDLGTIRQVVDRVLFLEGGKIYFQGSPQAFLNSEDRVIQSFLGLPSV